MIMTKHGWYRLMYTIGISCIICLLTTFTLSDESFAFSAILQSIRLGITIWFVAENIFLWLQKKFPYTDVPSYIALVMVIGLGTGGGLFMMGNRGILSFIIIICIAEFAGVLIALIYKCVYSKQLNEGLQQFKNQRR